MSALVVWKTAKTLGYEFFTQSDADDGEGDYGRIRTQSILPLDRIPKEIVGKARVARVVQRAEKLELYALHDVLRLLTSDVANAPDWYQEMRKERPPPHRAIDGRYNGHRQELVAAGLLEPLGERTVLHYSGYFAVMKDAERSRSIFNGKKLSERCDVPASVNLIDIRELVTKIVAHGVGGRQSQGYFVVMGDFRHWFHQIPAPEWMRSLFGMDFGEERYRWTSIPMGWSWSPLLAQAMAWAFLSYREGDESPLLDESLLKQNYTLPRWVPVSGGFVTVYYDNFFVLTNDVDVARAWEARILLNAERLRVAIKAGTLTLLTNDDIEGKGFDFLGVRFQTKGRKRPFAITVEPKKGKDWRDSLGQRDSPAGTFREAASWVGKGIFAMACCGKGVSRQRRGRELILLASELGRAHQNQWNSPTPAALWERTAETCRTVFKEAIFTTEFRAERARRSQPRPEIVVATDSSGRGYGWVSFVQDTESLQPLKEGCATNKGIWHGNWEHEHIFLKELECAVRAYRAWKTELPDSRIILVIDNSAAYYAIRNAFSTSKKGQSILDAGALPGEDDEVVLVVSKNNPADCPSRDEWSDYQERVQRLFQALAAFRRGGRRTGGEAAFSGKRPEVRHGEAEGREEQPDEIFTGFSDVGELDA